MEKLIELLNEKEGDTFVSIKWDEDHFKDDYFKNYERKIISKRYGFIKWLVEKDKIDFDNRELKDKFMEEFERYPTFHNNTYNQDFNINGLLMLLAISDTPIEDLISYLK